MSFDWSSVPTQPRASFATCPIEHLPGLSHRRPRPASRNTHLLAPARTCTSTSSHLHVDPHGHDHVSNDPHGPPPAFRDSAPPLRYVSVTDSLFVNAVPAFCPFCPWRFSAPGATSVLPPYGFLPLARPLSSLPTLLTPLSVLATLGFRSVLATSLALGFRSDQTLPCRVPQSACFCRRQLPKATKTSCTALF